MELLLELIRSMGNAIVRIVFRQGQIEQNSILSDAIGTGVWLAFLAAIIWLITTVIG